MLGIDGKWVAFAYLLCIIATVLCIVYGALKWNKDGGEEIQPEDISWAREEEEVEEIIE